jgi:hypothetical protein
MVAEGVRTHGVSIRVLINALAIYGCRAGVHPVSSTGPCSCRLVSPSSTRRPTVMIVSLA